MQGKKILLGITGSIAAYKTAHLVRLFVRAGAEVQVVMTRASTDFISPLTLSTLSKRPVFTELQGSEGWHNHVELGLWADAMIVAPASANTLSKMAHGLCDNLLSACYLSARCPVFVAPAMDLDMWAHPATRSNLERLAAHGVRTLPVGEGELASGLHGPGRMAEPEDILGHLDAFFSEKQLLRGKKVLVTAGPTHEAIDPVRFIGNHSTGKMGIALADALCAAGAEVTLVLGPTPLRPASAAVEVVPVRSAQEMFEACSARFSGCDIAVFSAAVADYAPREAAPEKIKKHEGAVVLELVRTPDIAGTLSPQKKPGQLVVGFALETENERANALDKLHRKKFDLLVLNSLRDEGAGFGHDTNRVTLFDARGDEKALPLMDKRAVAQAIVRAVAAAI